MAKSMEELIELIDKIPEEPAKPGEFILPVSQNLRRFPHADGTVFEGDSPPVQPCGMGLPDDPVGLHGSMFRIFGEELVGVWIYTFHVFFILTTRTRRHKQN